MARNFFVGSDARFDDAIHAPTRLRLCALLSAVDFAEFSTITSTLEVSEANLSKTIKNLVDLGYVGTSKDVSPDKHDSRRRTNVSLTAVGRRAFDGHLAALQELADSSRSGAAAHLPNDRVAPS